jgi:DNA repair protein RadA/Sms
MTKKIKTTFVCEQCGADYARWNGQCTSCGEWNTIKEIRLEQQPLKKIELRLAIRGIVQKLSGYRM